MKIYSLIPLLALSLVCGPASTARSDITAFFTAGDNGPDSGTNPGVYQIDASIPSARASLFIPAGGALSLSNPRGIAYGSNSDLNISGTSNYSLLVSSAGNNSIDAYNLDGSPALQIDLNQIGEKAPQRMVSGPAVYNPAFGATSVDVIVGEPNANGVLLPAQSILNFDSAGFDPLDQNILVGAGGAAFGHEFTSIAVDSYQRVLFGGTINGQAVIQALSFSPHSNPSISVNTVASNLAGAPVGMAVGPFGLLYVAEAAGGPTGGFVEKFSPTGSDLGTVLTLNPNTNSAIEDLGFGPDGKLYVLEQDRLDRFNIAVGAAVLEQTNAFPTGTVANTLLMAPNTLPGGVLNLSYSAAIAGLLTAKPMSLVIHNVQAPGVTNAVGVDPATLPSLPGVTLLGAVNLWSSALFTGPITLDFSFDQSLLPEGVPYSDLRLFSYDPTTGYQMVPTSLNLDLYALEGDVNSLGTFAIGVVPEPSSFILCGLGAIGLSVVARRSRFGVDPI